MSVTAAGQAKSDKPRKSAAKDFELPTGPMRVFPFSITELRVSYAGDKPKGAPASSLRMQVGLTGARLGDIVAIGGLFINEMVDDTGKVLVSPDKVDIRDGDTTSPARVSQRILRRGMIHRVCDINEVTSRDAKKIAKASGWITLVYGKETEDILIDNPLQYMGGLIKHPRLEELGLKVRVVDPGTIEDAKKRQGVDALALQFEGCYKSVRSVEFYDAWFKPLFPRSHPVRPDQGYDYYVYEMSVGKLDADTQLVLKVYPKIEVEKVRFEFKDLDLP